MSERPPTCPQGHAITWIEAEWGWCECNTWHFGVYGLQLFGTLFTRSILAALRQARADLAEKDRELRVEKQKARDALKTFYAETTELRANLAYHKDWEEHWLKVANERKAEIDRVTQGNSLVIVGSTGPPMVPLDLQVCVVCGKEAKGAQNVGQMIGTSERWEWRCEAHQLIALTVETVRGYADQVAEAKRDLAAEVPHG
ncbi:MAG: hypothetical protein KGL39_05725 [Patescibacteria group bacterium]|nr:hypothetical protein [Patescibacteria group bacterium]